MNTRRAVLTTSAAVLGAAVLGIGVLAGVASATPGGRGIADLLPNPTATCTGTGGPDGAGQGMGARAGGGAGAGRTGGQGTNRPATAGSGLAAGTFASDTLTDAQRDQLVFMIEEEKLAHDVYTTLSTSYDAPVFARIASSESQHMLTLRSLADSYGIDDPSSDVVGQFANSELATMYTTLVEQGQTSLADAYQVGQAVEKDDIARLATASDGLAAPDLQNAYAHLNAGSERHLAAFGG